MRNLGQVAYEQFRRGKEEWCKPWDTLGENVKAVWISIANAVLLEYGKTKRKEAVQ